MKIIILGAGQVGTSVAESLVSEANDITVIDTDPARLRVLQDRLDLRGVVGNGIQPSVLREAGIEDADMLIACAPLDETNLVACKVAHDLFNVPTTIARVRSPEFADGSPLLGKSGFAVDQVICPEQSVTAYIRKLIEYPEALQVLEFARRPGEPDRGARGGRRAAGAATAWPRSRRWCPAPRCASSPSTASDKALDAARRRHPHRARRRGLRARRHRAHPHRAGRAAPAWTGRCAA
ncbi:MAG: NAD-binding protein [Comamonadaceae bacterium]|nr:NAD-binding protein [Comamonadaceae bacterium]